MERIRNEIEIETVDPLFDESRTDKMGLEDVLKEFDPVPFARPPTERASDDVADGSRGVRDATGSEATYRSVFRG